VFSSRSQTTDLSHCLSGVTHIVIVRWNSAQLIAEYFTLLTANSRVAHAARKTSCGHTASIPAPLTSTSRQIVAQCRSETVTVAQQEMFGNRPQRVGRDERQGGHDDRRGDDIERIIRTTSATTRATGV
jgi:hypothetical protein